MEGGDCNIPIAFLKKRGDNYPARKDRVPTRQGKVREIWFFFKVREKSGNSVKWSGKSESLQKSGNFTIMLG